MLRILSPKYRRPGRPISVSASPLCPDADISFVGSLVACYVLCGGFLEVWAGSSLGELVPIMVGCGTLAGKSAVMGLHVGLRSLLGKGFSVIF